MSSTEKAAALASKSEGYNKRASATSSAEEATALVTTVKARVS